LADGDTLATRLTRGLFSATIILLVAELIWQIAKTVIEYPYRSSAVSGMCDRTGRVRDTIPNFLGGPRIYPSGTTTGAAKRAEKVWDGIDLQTPRRERR
jgi:hypothetical protein